MQLIQELMALSEALDKDFTAEQNLEVIAELAVHGGQNKPPKQWMLVTKNDKYELYYCALYDEAGDAEAYVLVDSKTRKFSYMDLGRGDYVHNDKLVKQDDDHTRHAARDASEDLDGPTKPGPEVIDRFVELYGE